MRYIVTGRVHPERADVQLGPHRLNLPDGGHADFKCESSQVTVVLESTTFIDGYITAFINAQLIAEMAIGVLGFWLGTGYSVELIQVLEGDEATPRVLGVRPTDETTGKSLGFEGPILERALKLAKRDAFFRLAVNDYVRAIPALLDCPTYCNRAIEAVKSSFDNKAGGDDWQLMHCALGTDKDTIIATVQSYAGSIRHGNWLSAKPTTSDERWKMLVLTRDILYRYLDHEEPESASSRTY